MVWTRNPGDASKFDVEDTRKNESKSKNNLPLLDSSYPDDYNWISGVYPIDLPRF
ncbi:MAG: hypothetical protein NPIRA06_09600 [Nitrospirales bacterium]|nr:MAG: hypothetical protein NPIRA06_09600 [Nitrospirales bacterium]